MSMKLEHYPQNKLKKEIANIVGKYLDLKRYKVFFFGSRVRGENFERADIDIGIEGHKEVPAGIKLQIEEDIDKLPLLYKFDIVDFKRVSPEFRKVALEHIEYVS